jgi:5'-AMP-activated protein kinase, catalytic alpha subunit
MFEQAMMSRGKILMGRYELGRVLGKGTFGKVHYARNLDSDQGVAVKVLEKDRALKAGLSEQIKREITTMSLVAHQNVVELHEVMATRNKIYLVMEYVKGGDLFDKIERRGRLTEEAAHRYFQQLISAVDCCHCRGVFHRDLKLENLLLDEDQNNVKVSDFGLSALSDSRRRDGGLLHTTCGTPAYVAPEVIAMAGYDGAKSDIWSCGVVLFALAAGHLPFQGPNFMEMYRKIQHGDFRCPGWFPRKLKKLLYRILDPNPSTRISIRKIRESTWFRRGPCRCEERAPSSRNAVTDAARQKKQNAREDVKKPLTVTNLNAFEIISLSAGFDLSGMFVDKGCKRETRFLSDKPASAIVLRLEDVAKTLDLRVRKKDNGVMKIQGKKEGRSGVVQFDAEIFEITPFHHVVEMRQTGGDSLEYWVLLEEGVRPALKDVVWAWHGDDQQQKQE